MAILGFWLAASACGQSDPFADFVRKTDPLTPAEAQRSFHVPPGFEIQLVASEPEINKPLNLAFDERERLWLTQSREYPYAAPTNQPGRDEIKILSDFDDSGRARSITTFADGLNIPIGIHPWQGGAIAFSIPYIYHFQDTDGDGCADKRDDAYAWLAAGRFEPPVMPLPDTIPNPPGQRQQNAADLVRTVPLPKLAARMAQLSDDASSALDARAAAASALVTLNQQTYTPLLARKLGDTNQPVLAREIIAAILAGLNSSRCRRPENDVPEGLDQKQHHPWFSRVGAGAGPRGRAVLPHDAGLGGRKG